MRDGEVGGHVVGFEEFASVADAQVFDVAVTVEAGFSDKDALVDGGGFRVCSQSLPCGSDSVRIGNLRGRRCALHAGWR